MVNGVIQSLMLKKVSIFQYYDDVNLFGFDCAGRLEGLEKDGDWRGNQVQLY